MRTSLVLSIFIALAAGGAAAAPPQPGTSETPSESLAALSASFEALAQRVAPSVVEIFTNGYTVGPGQPNVLARQQGSGSGVVLDTEGHIVTNAHVVAGARRIQVLLPVLEDDPGGRSGGVKPRPGKVDAHLVALDSATDLAVLKIAEAGLHPLPFGDSDKLRQGQLVLAFGSPLGLGSTVTLGVVSAVARQLGPDDTMVYVQTDAPINPGNSGGPLVDTQGQAVGLNTMIMTQSGGSEGIGLAIPSNTVRAIAEQLLRSGRVRRGVIGVQVQAVTPVMAAAMHLTQAWGVIVSDMLDSGPAAKAGVQVGDLVVSAGGRAVQ
ncbi:MAG TPA: trypsin-like peptidase domain-containing protein, partial [Thermoanaerobaculaceae bacterium]|nr:trypsin-like peptidase domain-containing protein [Thermoanaerobaculaceae bacterium]